MTSFTAAPPENFSVHVCRAPGPSKPFPPSANDDQRLTELRSLVLGIDEKVDFFLQEQFYTIDAKLERLEQLLLRDSSASSKDVLLEEGSCDRCEAFKKLFQLLAGRQAEEDSRESYRQSDWFASKAACAGPLGDLPVRMDSASTVAGSGADHAAGAPVRSGLALPSPPPDCGTQSSEDLMKAPITVKSIDCKSDNGSKKGGPQEGRLKPKVFANPDEVKDLIRNAIDRHEYDVKDHYKTEGLWQKIARSPRFENFTLAVIATNSLWMSIDIDYNKAEFLPDAHPVFIIAEVLTCFYFVVEIFIRFFAFADKCHALRDFQFLFDSGLVLPMILESWILPLIMIFSGLQGTTKVAKNAVILRLLRLMRIIRMARLVRLVRAMPELMIMIKGMSMAARSVLLTLCLLVIAIYVFGIAMASIASDTSAGQIYWKDVATSMKTLLLHGCFLEDLPEVINHTGEDSILYAGIVLLFVLLSSMTIMNMLVGVLCEVVSVVAAIEKEQLQVEFVKNAIQGTLNELNGTIENTQDITRDEFYAVLATPSAMRGLQEVGVDVVGLVDFGDYIFGVEPTISLTTFLETVLQLRGSNVATVKDMVDMRKCLINEFKMVDSRSRGRMLDMFSTLSSPASPAAENRSPSPTGTKEDRPTLRVSASRGFSTSSSGSKNYTNSVSNKKKTCVKR
eukprot:TRINITY_DN34436_c0_g2_i1.p1 TRINITY_DN34436_c0_g2~~TRINITY_DN34436_c0_g2_i1.p1  ORF type:complete len:679 (-),score=160.20 TRINITY_DN34436_c0_g2_i1:146-2182(-)